MGKKRSDHLCVHLGVLAQVNRHQIKTKQVGTTDQLGEPALNERGTAVVDE